jgi:hypothetical protein
MRLCDLEAAMREIVAGLEPETLSADAAAALVETFATIEKLAGAGKARGPTGGRLQPLARCW